MVRAMEPITAVLAAFMPANAAPTSATMDSLLSLAADEGRTCGPQAGGGFIMCPRGPEMLCCSPKDRRCRRSRSRDACNPEKCLLPTSSTCAPPAKRDPVARSSTTSSATVAPAYHFGYKEDDDDEDGDDHDGADPKQIPISYLESLPRPHIGSLPYGQVITSCAVPGTIALTFDDGPSAYTSDLLNLLDSENVRATFFVCGGNLDWDQITGHGNPAVLRRMMTAGHQVGSHTWGHPDLATMTEEQALSHMYKNEQALLSILGVVPTYLRPPYLSTAGKTLEVMDKLGYHVVNLDLDTRDWTRDYAAAEETFSNAVNSSDSRVSSHLVLAHDIHEQTVRQLAQFMINKGKAAGYRFVTVGECMGDPMGNWYRNPYNGRSWTEKKTAVKRRIDEDSCDSGNKHLGSDHVLNGSAACTRRMGLNTDSSHKHLEQTMYASEVAATSNAVSIRKISKVTRNVRPSPTKTMEIDFPFHGGQLPPTGFIDEAPTTTTEVAYSSVLPTSATTTGFTDEIPLSTMVSRRDIPFTYQGHKIFFDDQLDHEKPWSDTKTQAKEYNGGAISRAPSTLAFILGIAALLMSSA